MTLDEYGQLYVELHDRLASAQDGDETWVEIREMYAEAAKDGFGTFEVSMAAHRVRLAAVKETSQVE